MSEVQKPELNVFKDKSALSVAVATLLLLLFSFVVFRYFSNTSQGELNGSGAKDVVVEQSTDSEVADASTENNTDEKDTDTNNVLGTGGSYSQDDSTWVATDYKKGDLKGDTHTVKKGDTLWEIAEAYTGNGANWHQIADANNVSYMSNGNPLIVPGQTLTIPNLN